MVGRDDELGEIEAAWSRVVEGNRETVAVAGEPGAGKSRLVAEAAHAAHLGGALVLYGSGEGDAETPYAPFVTALARLERQAPAALLEEMRRSALGALVREAGSPTRENWSLGDDRARLFAASLEMLELLARRGPLLLAIDDLHACEASTLALATHLTRAAAGAPVLLLTTYRPTAVDPDGEVAATVAALRAPANAKHLELKALSPPALRDLAASLGIGPGEEKLDRTVATVARESGGNVLFACELLLAIGAGEATGGAAPDRTPSSLRTLIAARARVLGTDAHEHLSAAAVFGREFEPPALIAALGAEPAALSDSLRSAERAGLLIADPADGSYAFAHAIVARCLYEEVPPARRGELHRQIAEALEASDGEGLADRLAHHWRRAEPPDRQRAARWCATAGRQALRGHDHETAAGWFEQALALREEDPAEERGAEHCDLLIDLGTALRFVDQERSREHLLAAARLADDLDDAERLTRAALANNRGFVSHVGGLDRERGAMLSRAAERLDANRPEAALVLAQLALELTFSSQVDRRRWLADRALEAARAGGDRRILAQALIRCLIARWGPDNPEERIAIAAESIEIGAQLDQPLDLFHALHWQAVAQVEVGEIADAAHTLHEQEQIAARVGDATARWLCECSASVHLALRGKLAEAEARAQWAVEGAKSSSQPDALPFYVSQIASIRWQQGRLAELAPLLTRALDEYPGIPAFRSLATLANAVAGEKPLANEILATDTVTDFADIPRDPIWIAAATTYAHAIAELEDPAAATALRPLLEPYRGRLAMTTVSIWGLVDHALGRLELLLGEREAGQRSLRTAAAAYAAIPAPLWRAQAEADLGVADTTESPLETRIAALGLTDRQAEVTRLIARGLSNREVAEELQVSPSTVKRHLEDVYRRTGVRSRGALTALLLE
jgi:DNA-binding CsgD family transcriptional regulator